MLAVGSAVLYSSTADWPSFILDSFSVFITCNDWHTFFFIFVRASTKIGHCLLWAFERPAVSCSYVEIWHGTEQGKCSFSSHNVFYFVRNDTSIRVDLIFIPLWKKKQTNKQMIANGYRVVSSEFLAKFPFLIQRLFFLFWNHAHQVACSAVHHRRRSMPRWCWEDRTRSATTQINCTAHRPLSPTSAIQDSNWSGK